MQTYNDNKKLINVFEEDSVNVVSGISLTVNEKEWQRGRRLCDQFYQVEVCTERDEDCAVSLQITRRP